MKLLRWFAALLAALVVTAAALVAWFGFVPDPDPQWRVELEHSSLPVDGIVREFVYFAPNGLRPGAPMVFVLHGSASGAAGMRRFSGYEFERIAKEKGAIVVYPQGFENHWNDCRAGADYSANTRNIDDPAFFAAMIDYFVARYGADRGRVLVTGLSNGGHMAYRLALEAPELVLAIAPMAAGLPAPSNLDCRESGRAVAVAIFNGTEDPVNPFEGGVVSVLGNTSRGAVRSSLDTANYWAALAGYRSLPDQRQLPDLDPEDGTTVTRLQWDGNGKPEVLHYTIRGGGHTVPSRRSFSTRTLGRTTHDIDGAREAWAFFERQQPRIPVDDHLQPLTPRDH
jgi:polyhydroxybutyrate depolymerase